MYLVGRSRVKQKLTHILLCFRGTTNTPLGNKLVYYTHLHDTTPINNVQTIFLISL